MLIIDFPVGTDGCVNGTGAISRVPMVSSTVYGVSARRSGHTVILYTTQSPEVGTSLSELRFLLL